MAFPFQSDQVEDYCYIDNVFTKEECEKLIEYGNSFEKRQGLVIGNMLSNDSTVYEDLRKVNIVPFEANKETLWFHERLAETILYANEKYFNFHLTGFNESVQFAEYKEGDFFVTHVDKTFNRPIRKLSISVMLNDKKDYEGGDFIMHTQGTTQALEQVQGRAFIFASYIPHEITKITKGTRYAMFGWVSGNQFK